MKQSRQQAVTAFIDQLACDRVMMHGFLLKHRGETIAEGYYKPFRCGEPHRMFSVSKTATALAIGLLLRDQRIHLDDPIVRYFPDKLPGTVPAEIAAMTVRDMLCMTSCFARTAFNSETDQDWVKGFFHAPPAHDPGTIFSYDSSASHVLCALVERMCGEEILTFLQQRLFSPLHMRDDKRWLKDPAGVSQGATGLVLSLRDMSRMTEFLLSDGMGLLAPSFLREATALQTPTIQRHMPEERYGYGYQIWQIRRGFAMFGMGGQLGIALPEREITLCTIADTQLDAVGVQQIYDAFFRCLADADLAASDPEAQRELDAKLASLTCLSVDAGIGAQPSRFGTTALAPNAMGIRSVMLDAAKLCWETEQGTVALPYGTGETIQAEFRGQPCITSGGWPSINTFYLRCYLIGDTPCGFDVTISWHMPHVTLRLTRAPDALTDGMEGEACGTMQGA